MMAPPCGDGKRDGNAGKPPESINRPLSLQLSLQCNCIVLLQMEGVSMILIVLLMFITPCKTKICFSELELCSNCNNTYAICDTSAIDSAIPQNLSTELQSLTIRYNGPKLQLTGNMFKRYPLIDSLALSGKISSLAEETFATLQFLRKLSITYSYLESLPDSLFHPNNSLWSLEIGNNKLSAIPDHLFKELQTLESLDLA